MGTIIFLGILAVFALGGLAFTLTNKGHWKDYRGKELASKRAVFGGITALFTFIFLLVFVLSSVSYPGQRTVGIVTEFGKPVATIQPGFNWTSPWAEVTEFPTSNQTLDLDATDNTDEHKANPVVVKFNGGGEGDVNVNITWQVQNDDKALDLWRNWKDFELVKSNVVNPRGQSAVAEVFGALKPEDATNGQRIPEFNKSIQEKLNTALASSGITVENVAIKRINVSQAIQDRINKQVEDQADLNRSRIKQDTAKVDAETNRIAQQNLTTEVMRNKCLDVSNNWNVAKNGPLPANWNCNEVPGLPLTKSVG